jgi:N-dimethylarginine dimethylaminohydrolase
MTFTTPKQSRKRPLQKTRRAPQQRIAQYARLIEFRQARGKTVERVELNTDSDFRCISIHFQDDTDLTFVLDPALTLRVDYSRWKDGEQKVLKRWPVFRSDGM